MGQGAKPEAVHDQGVELELDCLGASVPLPDELTDRRRSCQPLPVRPNQAETLVDSWIELLPPGELHPRKHGSACQASVAKMNAAETLLAATEVSTVIDCAAAAEAVPDLPEGAKVHELLQAYRHHALHLASCHVLAWPEASAQQPPDETPEVASAIGSMPVWHPTASLLAYQA